MLPKTRIKPQFKITFRNFKNNNLVNSKHTHKHPPPPTHTQLAKTEPLV